MSTPAMPAAAVRAAQESGDDVVARMTPLALLHRIAEVVGFLPTQRFSQGRLSNRYFTADASLLPFWQMSSSADSAAVAVQSSRPDIATRESRLAHALNIVLGPGSSDSHLFVSFLCGLLDPDPVTRLTPAQAVLHPFLMPLFPLSMFVHRSGEFGTPVRCSASLATGKRKYRSEERRGVRIDCVVFFGEQRALPCRCRRMPSHSDRIRRRHLPRLYRRNNSHSSRFVQRMAQLSRHLY